MKNIVKHKCHELVQRVIVKKYYERSCCCSTASFPTADELSNAGVDFSKTQMEDDQQKAGRFLMGYKGELC